MVGLLVGIFLEAESFADVPRGSAERVASVTIAFVERVVGGIVGDGEGVVCRTGRGIESSQRIAARSAADGDDSLLGMPACIEPRNVGAGKFVEPRENRCRKIRLGHFSGERPCG